MPSLGNFDPNQHHDSYEPLPAGDYLVMITESTIDQKDDGAQFVKVTMEVMQPEQHYGRKCFANFTLEHANPKAVEVGRKILSNLCRAVGVMAPRETEELHGIPFFTRLVVDQWDDGSLHNEAKAYWSTQSQAPPQPKPKAPKAQAGPGSQYQPPAPPAWQPPTAPQQRLQAPQQPWQQPQGGAPGGFRPPQAPAAPQQWQQPPAAPHPGQGGQPAQNWQPAPPQPPQQPYYPPQAPQQPQYPPQPQQQAHQPPAQPQAPQAPAGPPPWAQQPQGAPQAPHQPMLDADGNEIPF